jgi:hypothetical protein
MDRPASFPAALSRLDGALDRLEALAASRPQAAAGDGGNAALAVLEAERDLLQLRHRRLVQSTERAVADLDALIASRT